MKNQAFYNITRAMGMQKSKGTDVILLAWFFVFVNSCHPHLGGHILEGQDEEGEVHANLTEEKQINPISNRH